MSSTPPDPRAASTGGAGGASSAADAAQRELLQALPDAAAVVGTDGRIRLANRLMDQLAAGGKAAGYTALEMTRSAELADAVGLALRGISRRFELSLPARQRTVLVQLAPLSGGQALLVLRDLTESKRMEAARRDFVANASHELRTPVTAIVGAAETLLGGAVEEAAAARKFVEMIARHADRLSRLTQDLLDLSRIESGERSVRLEPVALTPLFEELLEFFRQRAEEKQLDLRTELPQGLCVVADRQALDQAVVNLVDNAIKYTPAGGQVTLFAEADAGWVTLAVADTGPGIERHHLPRLFERFYRADAGRARTAGGIGLGLAIVKHLIQAQGGEVGVDSDQGGSRFWLRLRAAPA